MRSERYEINSDRPKLLELSIQSQPDGNVMTALIQERFVAPVPAAPTAPSEVASRPALADSKSAAEFTLATCLPAMDDLSKVEIMARENNGPLNPPRIAVGSGRPSQRGMSCRVRTGFLLTLG